MSSFDPYYKWLGIRPAEQPANHYRLLAIPLFETDLDVIEAAAERQTIYLRTFQSGPHAELAEELLNQVSSARICLLQAQEKILYDQQLRAKQVVDPPKVVAPPSLENEEPVLPAAVEVAPREEFAGGEMDRPSIKRTTKYVRRARKHKSSSQGLVVVGSLVVFVIALLVLFNLPDGEKNPRVTSRKPSPRRKSPVPAGEKITKPSATGEETETPGEKPEDEQESGDPPRTTGNPLDENGGAETVDPGDQLGQLEITRKLLVPTEAEQKVPRSEWQKVFGVEYQAAKSTEEIEDRRAKLNELAKKLYNLADETGDDAAARFVMYERAYEIGTEAGNSDLTFDVLDDLEAEFLFDGWPRRYDALVVWSKKGMDFDKRRRLAITVAIVARIAEAKLRWKSSLKLYDLSVAQYEKARAIAARDRSDLLKKVVADKKNVAMVRGRMSELLAALEKLEDSPADGEANRLVGEYFCFVCRDWFGSLVYLEKSADPVVRSAAVLDVAGADDSAGKIKIGDAWWEAGEARSGEDEKVERAILQSRAGFWYQQVRGEFTGVEGSKLVARMEAVKLANLSGVKLDFARPIDGRKISALWKDTQEVSLSGGGQVIPSLERGLVAYYPFNGNARDESGNEHHGNVNGAVIAQDNRQVAHVGYNFSEGHIDLPATLAKRLGGDSLLSVSLWVRFSLDPDVADSNRTMFALGAKEQNRSFVMVMIKGRFAYSQWEDGTITSDFEISDGKWHHCMVTYDGVNCSLYADGQLRAQEKLEANRDTEEIRIGNSYVSRNRNESWKDLIDDVRIYTRALSTAEVRALYEFEKLDPNPAIRPDLANQLGQAAQGTRTGGRRSLGDLISPGRGAQAQVEIQQSTVVKAEIAKISRSSKGAGPAATIKAFDDLLAKYKPSGEMLQEVLFAKSFAHFEAKQMVEAKGLLLQAKKLSPKSRIGGRIDGIIARYFTEKPGEAAPEK